MSERVERIVDQVVVLSGYELVELKMRLQDIWGDGASPAGVREPRRPPPADPPTAAHA